MGSIVAIVTLLVTGAGIYFSLMLAQTTNWAKNETGLGHSVGSGGSHLGQ